jgi:hypothetical protein
MSIIDFNGVLAAITALFGGSTSAKPIIDAWEDSRTKTLKALHASHAAQLKGLASSPALLRALESRLDFTANAVAYTNLRSARLMGKKGQDKAVPVSYQDSTALVVLMQRRAFLSAFP